MSHDSLLLLWLVIHPPLAGCVWGVRGVLMDRKQTLWMKVVREWIGSMDEGPVMVDYRGSHTFSEVGEWRMRKKRSQ
jgi:hypothetical protein